MAERRRTIGNTGLNRFFQQQKEKKLFSRITISIHKRQLHYNKLSTWRSPCILTWLLLLSLIKLIILDKQLPSNPLLHMIYDGRQYCVHELEIMILFANSSLQHAQHSTWAYRCEPKIDWNSFVRLHKD